MRTLLGLCALSTMAALFIFEACLSTTLYASNIPIKNQVIIKKDGRVTWNGTAVSREKYFSYLAFINENFDFKPELYFDYERGAACANVISFWDRTRKLYTGLSYLGTGYELDRVGNGCELQGGKRVIPQGR